jgi:hypothetical protein
VHQVTENFAYLPFGGGRRKCIGDQFALFEATVALSMLMRRYEFALEPSKGPVGMTTGAASPGAQWRTAHAAHSRPLTHDKGVGRFGLAGAQRGRPPGCRATSPRPAPPCAQAPPSTPPTACG